MSFDLQPVLRGERLTLRPLRVEDYQGLWEVARDPLVWEQHPDQTRHDPEGFRRFFAAALECGTTLVVMDNASGRIIGSTRFYEWDPERREVAVGYTFLSRAHWGGAANAEMKRLMIEHAAPHADTIWFHVGRDNLRSRRAMEKIGGELAFEGQRPLNGAMADFVYYRIRPALWRLP